MAFFDSIAIPQSPPPPEYAVSSSSSSSLSSSSSSAQSQFASSRPTAQVPGSVNRPAVSSRKFTETFRGFVKDPIDAALLIEACIANLLQPLNMVPMSLSDLQIRSGTVLVFAENSSMGQMVRWRDGCRWSASRLQGPFLLYREVETSSTSCHSRLQLDRENDPPRFINTVVRGKTRFVINGLAKRTLTLSGSDGNRYRVISYFYPLEVGHLYGDPVVASSSSCVTDKGDIDSIGRLSCPSSLRQFSRFLGVVCVPTFTMPDLSYTALSRTSAGSNLLALAQQQYYSPALISSPSWSSSSSGPSNLSNMVEKGIIAYPSPQQQNMHLQGSNRTQQEQVFLRSSDRSDCESERMQPLLKAVDLLRNNPQWMERPVQLAPLTGSKE
ncbi:hypothetical protein HK100_004697 [Physocladia obscura]|uniref:Uncharacterized protein n=1 Tax=Physocladia obscura TaxID=109957 RepID=A0AAD5XCE7_9FUNG|nr:hypothetical protein HK100_004697 [Physocladia obscura]